MRFESAYDAILLERNIFRARFVMAISHVFSKAGRTSSLLDETRKRGPLDAFLFRAVVSFTLRSFCLLVHIRRIVRLREISSCWRKVCEFTVTLFRYAQRRASSASRYINGNLARNTFAAESFAMISNFKSHLSQIDKSAHVSSSASALDSFHLTHQTPNDTHPLSWVFLSKPWIHELS